MMRILFVSCCTLLSCLVSHAQLRDGLTVEKIMRDPKWIGTSPSAPGWSEDGTLFFSWNPDKAPADSIYAISPQHPVPFKATAAQKQAYNTNYNYNQARTAFVYSRDGDIYYTDSKSGKTRRIQQTTETESNPQFSFRETRIVYTRNQNLYAWDIASGETIQLTNIRAGEAGGRSTSGGAAPLSQQEQWLKNDQLQYFLVLKERKEKREATDAYNKSQPREKEMRSISLEDKSLQGLSISPDGRFVYYRLFKSASNAKNTIVPSYVTESGFTTDIPARSKVGAPQGSSEAYLYDRLKDSIIQLKGDQLPGIDDQPDYVKDYPKQKEETRKKSRAISFLSMNWSPNGTHAVVEIRSGDNKDRWLALLDTATGKLKTLDRQRDEAWIGGPGTGGFGSGNTGWLDENTFWFRSEASGYSHLYTVQVLNGGKKALTSGRYEVQQVQLSRDKKYFYIQTNEVHPGEQHYYRLHIADGKKERLTFMEGANTAVLSPDEKWIAFLHSYSNKPWELYLQEVPAPGKAARPPVRVTDKSQSEEFRSYAWKDPEVISFPARDGAPVYARLYKPARPHPNKPAVLFVHGAGYLQNAHKWWSSYFREYMFNNMLADQGYYVMDIDYRGSAGYGRDWRTGIYRHMGGKDLSDHVDAVQYLVKNHGVNPAHVGLYGGSYGGFITLMGMFNEPDVFAAGASLRPVTDWANYNHGYTSNILNEPYTDSLAYRRSSPYYFAEGLKGHLLICHGMVDVNVHYQDAVKLAQRLIELGKDNWELASYPMEDHGFVEPSSWTDEYKRIFKLFESVLKK